jgi:hypothetical protein
MYGVPKYMHEVPKKVCLSFGDGSHRKKKDGIVEFVRSPHVQDWSFA